MGCTEKCQIKTQQHELLNKISYRTFNFLVPAQVHTEKTTWSTAITTYAINSLDLTSAVRLSSVKESVGGILCWESALHQPPLCKSLWTTWHEKTLVVEWHHSGCHDAPKSHKLQKYHGTLKKKKKYVLRSQYNSSFMSVSFTLLSWP